jgi:hypothetical protein
VKFCLVIGLCNVNNSTILFADNIDEATQSVLSQKKLYNNGDDQQSESTNIQQNHSMSNSGKAASTENDSDKDIKKETPDKKSFLKKLKSALIKFSKDFFPLYISGSLYHASSIFLHEFGHSLGCRLAFGEWGKIYLNGMNSFCAWPISALTQNIESNTTLFVTLCGSLMSIFCSMLAYKLFIILSKKYNFHQKTKDFAQEVIRYHIFIDTLNLLPGLSLHRCVNVDGVIIWDILYQKFGIEPYFFSPNALGILRALNASYSLYKRRHGIVLPFYHFFKDLIA